jgi:hypothetical protein
MRRFEASVTRTGQTGSNISVVGKKEIFLGIRAQNDPQGLVSRTYTVLEPCTGSTSPTERGKSGVSIL